VITPQLQQAIKLLQLTNLELEAYVEAELERNPLLQRDERDSDPEPEPVKAETPTADYSVDSVPDSAAQADMDAGPTKSWLFRHREDPQWKTEIDLAFGLRPAEEFYLLEKDPDQLRNLAEDPTYAADKARLKARLMELLEKTGDPRVTGDKLAFERPPFAGGP
jgi:DNA-directed RNA polymerase specialized sigma54-like protein